MGIKLIVGLGNPGHEYVDTRHNTGFWLLDNLAHKYKVQFSLAAKFFGEIAKFKHHDVDIFLLKPQTFMNLSGKSVTALASFYKILPQQILVVHDELDLNPDMVKMKQGGGHGGHNGLRDIDRVIGRDYWRLRLGIGHPGDKNKVISYVLNVPSLEQKLEIDRAIDKSLAIFDLLLEGKFEAAMKSLHTA